MKEVIVNENDAGQRLDKYLMKAFPALKKSALYKGVRNKKIKINRKRASFDQKLEAGDHILLFLPPDLLEQRDLAISKADTPDIVYEDENILALFKPVGLLSQKESVQDQNTLNDQLLWYLYESGQFDPSKEASFTPSIAHRLDRNTSGLVLAAKNAKSQRLLSQAIHDHLIRKSYLALVEGKPEKQRLEKYLKKEGTIALVEDVPAEGYVPAIMEIIPLRSQNGQTLIQADLETGRFHQIRALMAHEGCPLVGDHKYGYEGTVPFQQLQAFQVDLSRAPGLESVGTIALPEARQLKWPDWKE